LKATQVINNGANRYSEYDFLLSVACSEHVPILHHVIVSDITTC